MRKSFTILALATLFSALAAAETFEGKLIDAACYQKAQQDKSTATCDPTTSTTTFALFLSGKAFTLDDTGNTKATEAMKNAANRSADPSKLTGTQTVIVKITGAKNGDTINVESLEIQ